MSDSRNRHRNPHPVAPALSMSSRSIDVDGASIYVEEHGDGLGIVLILGGLSTSADWAPAPLIPGLRDVLRVVTPDSRGHGRSTNPAGRPSYAAIADDTAAVIAALGLRRPVVAGWSDGGRGAGALSTLDDTRFELAHRALGNGCGCAEFSRA